MDKKIIDSNTIYVVFSKHSIYGVFEDKQEALKMFSDLSDPFDEVSIVTKFILRK